jgi:hypothetical protein
VLKEAARTDESPEVEDPEIAKMEGSAGTGNTTLLESTFVLEVRI